MLTWHKVPNNRLWNELATHTQGPADDWSCHPDLPPRENPSGPSGLQREELSHLLPGLCLGGRGMNLPFARIPGGGRKSSSLLRIILVDLGHSVLYVVPCSLVLWQEPVLPFLLDQPVLKGRIVPLNQKLSPFPFPSANVGLQSDRISCSGVRTSLELSSSIKRSVPKGHPMVQAGLSWQVHGLPCWAECFLWLLASLACWCFLGMRVVRPKIGDT